ncbi:hypothetical protein [Pseudonocardia nigra]|uniref:hypothetical protein n=1 Tax=Pseudonocardia nigra TaxID=1921578 RepID=UPI001C5EFCC2|nr:hypothetical protein [Pseudonocardia nigra]
MIAEPLAAELVEFISAETCRADRLLARHVDDGTGHCRVCSSGAQTGRHAWPCSIHNAAATTATRPGRHQ